MISLSSTNLICGRGGTGRRAGLRLLWILLPCGFKSHRPHQRNNPTSFGLWGFVFLVEILRYAQNDTMQAWKPATTRCFARITFLLFCCIRFFYWCFRNCFKFLLFLFLFIFCYESVAGCNKTRKNKQDKKYCRKCAN